MMTTEKKRVVWQWYMYCLGIRRHWHMQSHRDVCFYCMKSISNRTWHLSQYHDEHWKLWHIANNVACQHTIMSIEESHERYLNIKLHVGTLCMSLWCVLPFVAESNTLENIDHNTMTSTKRKILSRSVAPCVRV